VNRSRFLKMRSIKHAKIRALQARAPVCEGVTREGSERVEHERNLFLKRNACCERAYRVEQAMNVNYVELPGMPLEPRNQLQAEYKCIGADYRKRVHLCIGKR
jgi:hypothetical protein